MGTIRVRNGVYQAQCRKTGYVPQSKSFRTKSEAQRWINSTEPHLVCDKSEQQSWQDLLTAYEANVAIHQKGKAWVKNRVAFLRKLTWRSVEAITSKQVNAFIYDRLKSVCCSSVRREAGLIIAVLNYGNVSFKPKEIKRPVDNPSRTRRLRDGEYAALKSSLGGTDYLCLAIDIALETAMRRGEILSIRKQHINLQNNTLLIPNTKNGLARTIPLTDTLVRLIKDRPDFDYILPVKGKTFHNSWLRCRARAEALAPGISELHFHDLRHEAITRFFELGLSVAEVALISGHRDVRMLFRYTHLKPESVSAKLRVLQAQADASASCCSC